MAKIASRTVEVPGRTLSIEEATALVEKTQNLAGHFPTEEDIGSRAALPKVHEQPDNRAVEGAHE